MNARDRDLLRIFGLFGISIAAMGGLAFTAWLMICRLELNGLHFGLGLGLAVPIGLFVGLLSSPLVMLCLVRKPMHLAIPAVYAPSFVLLVVYCLLIPLFSSDNAAIWLSAAIPAFVSVCGLSILVGVYLPAIPARNRCQKCNYDLRGSSGTVCPECGATRASSEAARRSGSADSAH